MRKFLIAYFFSRKTGDTGFGNITFTFTGLLNEERLNDLREYIMNDDKTLASVMFMNLIELEMARK